MKLYPNLIIREPWLRSECGAELPLVTRGHERIDAPDSGYIPLATIVSGEIANLRCGTHEKIESNEFQLPPGRKPL